MGEVVDLALRIREEQAKAALHDTAESARDLQQALALVGSTADQVLKTQLGAAKFGAVQELRQLQDAETKLRAAEKLDEEAVRVLTERRKQLAAVLNQQAGASRKAAAATTNSTNKYHAFAQVQRNLAYQVSDVIQSIQAGQTPWRALSVQVSDVGFQLGSAAIATDGLKTSLLAAAPVVATLTVAVAAVATAVIVFMNHTAEARAELTRYKEVIDDTAASSRSLASSQMALRMATGDVKGFIADLAMQIAVLAGEMTHGEAAAVKLKDRLDKELRPKLVAAGQAFAENTRRIEELKASIDSGRLSFDELADAHEQLRKAKAVSPQLQDNLFEIKFQAGEAEEMIRTFANAQDAAAQKGDQTSDSLDRQRDAVERLTVSTRDLWDTMAQGGDLSDVTGISGSFEASVMGAGEKIAKENDQALKERLEEGQKKLEEAFRKRGKEQADAVRAASKEAEDALRRQHAMIASMASAVAGLATGDSSGLLQAGGAAVGSIWGPAGAAIGQAVGDIMGTLADDGAAKVADSIAGAVVDLTKAAPELIDLLIAKLPIALAKAIPEIVYNGTVGMVVALGTALGDWWSTSWSAIREFFRSLFKPKEGGFVDNLGNDIADAWSWVAGAVTNQSYAKQGYVSQTGMAMVHAGERITRAGGPQSTQVQRWASGGGTFAPTINAPVLSPDAIRPLVRELQRVYGSKGLRTSAVVG